MDVILIALISAILTSALVYLDNILESIIPITLYAEQYMDTILGSSGFESIFNLAFNFGISLIVLKFLKKCFDFYVLWLDGEPDIEPISLLTNFLRATVVALSSKTLYGWIASSVSDFINDVLSALGNDLNYDWSIIINGVASLGIFTAILSLIFFICFFFLYIQFLQRGMEMLILKIALPIAAIGLLDSDKGVFGSYMKKFFQSAVTIIVQIFLCKLAIGLMINTHVFWGIAAMMLSLRTPKFIQEFMLVTGGSGMGGIYHTARTFGMIKHAIGKLK